MPHPVPSVHAGEDEKVRPALRGVTMCLCVRAGGGGRAHTEVSPFVCQLIYKWESRQQILNKIWAFQRSLTGFVFLLGFLC